MWHTPNQRLRAIATAKRRERERNRRPFHLKRIEASLLLNSSGEAGVEPVLARVILNDLSTSGVGVFAQSPIAPGSEISMAITEPMQLDIRARVVWCQEHSANSHVLSATPFSYRMGLEFIVADPAEEQLIADFWKDLCANHLYT